MRILKEIRHLCLQILRNQEEIKQNICRLFPENNRGNTLMFEDLSPEEKQKYEEFFNKIING